MREPHTRRNATLFAPIWVAVFLLTAGHQVAWAQDDAATPPELIQAVESEKLGTLRLPAFWRVEDTADGIRAVEGNTDRPASIEIAILPIPERLSGDAIADAIVADMGPRLTGLSEELRDKSPEKDGVSRTFLVLSGQEGEHAVRYAVLILIGNRMAVFASVGSPADRFEELAPRALLTAILESIRAE